MEPRFQTVRKRAVFGSLTSWSRPGRRRLSCIYRSDLTLFAAWIYAIKKRSSSITSPTFWTWYASVTVMTCLSRSLTSVIIGEERLFSSHTRIARHWCYSAGGIIGWFPECYSMTPLACCGLIGTEVFFQHEFRFIPYLLIVFPVRSKFYLNPILLISPIKLWTLYYYCASD